MFRKHLYQTREVSKDIHRPRVDFCRNALVEVLDLKRHSGMLANTLTSRKGFVTPNVLAYRRAAPTRAKLNPRAGPSG